MKKFILLFILLAFATSCKKAITKEEITTRKKIENLIVKYYSRKFDVYVCRFKNKSKSDSTAYLEKAIPEMIYSYLKPIQNETAYIKFELDNLIVPDELKKAVLLTPEFFTNYLTNVESQVTQFTYAYITNSNYILITNITTNILVNNISNEIELTITNKLYSITTNSTATNLVKTNIYEFVDGKIYDLIANEYPRLTNTFLFLPISLKNVMKNTNDITNYKKNSVYVKGDFKYISKGSGPGQIKINMKLIKCLGFSNNIFATNEINVMESKTNYKRKRRGRKRKIAKIIVLKSTTNELTITNIIKITKQKKMRIQCREDQIAERTLDFLKPIRLLVLDKITGDLIIDSAPKNANIYLDGIFIGKSPLYYPAVAKGKHQFIFLKEGYKQINLIGNIIENKSNFIHTSIEKNIQGGIINITSKPTNARVFLDAEYIGNTPVSASNMVIGLPHRIKVMSDDTKAVVYPFYHSFLLNNTNQVLNIKAKFPTTDGQPLKIKKRAWYVAYSTWGIWVASLGFQYYAHSQWQHYLDLEDAYRTGEYTKQAEYYEELKNNGFTIMILSTFTASLFTINALKQEEIYLGFESTTKRPVYATISIRF